MSDKSTPENPELITPDELATELKVPKTWVYNQTRQLGPQAIPRLKVGKYLRFNLKAVVHWLERQSRGET